MEKKDLTNNNLSKEMTLEINFKGQEFENFVDILLLNKKLRAIDKTIKNSVEALKKTRKFKERKEIIESIKIDLKRNSIDNIILINFLLPTAGAIVGGLILDYIRNLAKKDINESNIKEIVYLNKNVSHLNQINNLIQVNSNHSIVEFKFANDKFVIKNDENLEIKKSIQDLKNELIVEEYEDSFIGRFGKIDNLDKNSLDYYFTPEFTEKKIPLSFENKLEKEELKDIIFDKIRINAIVQRKNEEITSIHVLDYDVVKRRLVTDYK